MYISARERRILELLLSKNDESTVKDLADELDVSTRTVHRDLKGVEEILNEYGLGLNKKSGIGIQLTGSKEVKEKLQLFLFNLSHSEYTPEERQTIILSELLDTKEPVKLLSLANDLNVTIATISNDLNKVEERLLPFKLQLLRKRGYGVEIIGTESDKRNAMSKLIIDHIDEFEFISIIKESIQKKSTQSFDTITDRLLGLVDRKKLLIIEKQIDDIKDDLPYSIADSAYIGLVVHLALAIERIQQGETINFDEDYLKSLEHTIEFKVAEKIVAGLEEVFHIKISVGEIGYITMHLMGAKIRNEQEDLLTDSSFQVSILAQSLIRYVSAEIGTDLTKNMSLFQGLVAHLRPALYRIKQNMGISNPLLIKIEHDYSELFTLLTKAVKVIFPDLHVPKEEVGYLVMHFASALLKKEDVKEVKTLVVCSSGIGTSKILSSKLEQQIPGIKTAYASLFDLESMDINNYDAIISTIPLKDLNEDYIVVSPLLSEEEIDKVRRFVLSKKHHLGREYKKVEVEKLTTTNTNFLFEIEKIKHYSNAIYQLLSGFTIYTVNNPFSIEQVLEKMCQQLIGNAILHNCESVVRELMKREELGGLGIPGTSLALFHTRSEYINVPSFTIGRLAHPLVVKAMDHTEISMDTVLLMLSPKEVNDETLEILSGISSLIIRDTRTITAFEKGSKEELLDLLSIGLKEIYKEKMNH